MSARVCRSLASRALTVQARAVLPAGVSRCARSFSSLVRRVPRSVGSHVPTRWRRASIRSASTAPPQSMDTEAAAERPSAASGARMSPRVADAAPSLGGQGGSASDVDVAGVTHAAVEPAPEGGGQVVTVEWASGDVAWFHGVWLRDNCQCAECVDQQTRQRVCDTRRVDVAIVPDVLEVAADGSVDVTWPAADAEDGAPRHRSTFAADWLQANAYWSQSTASLQEGPPQLPQRAWVSADFDPSTVDERGFASMVAAVGVGESMAQSRVAADAGKTMGLPSVAYERVMEEEAGVHEWLELVHHHGFAFVHGVPATMEATEAVSRRIGFVQETMYGRMWVTEVLPDQHDSAYQAVGLECHTDGSYWNDPPGLQIFHCLKQAASGGDSLLMDGKAVAETLRRDHPDSYEFLSTVPVNCHSVTGDGTYHCLRTILEVDDHGDFKAIRYNNLDRAPTVASTLPPHRVPEMYTHLQRLQRLLFDPDLTLQLALTPGLLIAIDNWRVLHGRLPFDESSGRALAGCYMPEQETRVRREALRERFGGAGWLQ